MVDRLHLAVADDEVGVTAQDRRHQFRDIGRAVLVVGVGVDDHVRAQLQRCVEARLEALCESFVVRQPYDVVDTVGTSDLDGGVGGPVVDDEPLDLIEALHLAREVG